MWIGNRSRTDRILAAVEILAMGLWLGALCGFAFIQAPSAFAIVGQTDVVRFAALTAANLHALALLGSICGAIAIVITLVRSRTAGERTFDFVRALLVVIALGLVWFEMATIVPAMARIADLHSAEYHALHTRSSIVYGGVVLLAAVVLVMAAIRRDT